MHLLLILIPVAGAVFGPRLWAQGLMRRYDQDDPGLPEAAEAARTLLDAQGLEQVRVEVTDLGAHYDPVARAVRVPRERFHRHSLTALATVAHEVGHATQDAEGYWPFRLHLGLARIARISGELGTALLLAVPVAALAGQGPLPSRVVGGSAAAMLGTSLAAQLAALPSEFNASFGRALPMLDGGMVPMQRLGQARWLLLACSATYLSASFNPMLLLWTWFGIPVGARMARLCPTPDVAFRPRFATAHGPSASLSRETGASANPTQNACTPQGLQNRSRRFGPSVRAAPSDQGRPVWVIGLQHCARPLVRVWLRHHDRLAAHR